MNKFLISKNGNFLYVFLLAIAIGSCNYEIDDVLLTPEEVSVSNTELPSQVSNYLGKLFYLKSSDKKEPVSTTRTQLYDKVLTRSYSIHADVSGEKYLGAHVMAAFVNKEKLLQDIEVWVNNQYVGNLDIKSNEWDFVTLKELKAIYLNSGNNVITFASKVPYYPEIDAIQVEDAPNSLVKEDPMYEDFINHLKMPKSDIKEKTNQVEIENKNLKVERENSLTRSAYNSNYDWQVTPITLDNPDGNYVHKMLVPVVYTYHRKLSLSKGTYTFQTGPIDGDNFNTVDPVMYLYKIDDPHNYSFYNDDASGLGLQSQINATLPEGEYFLVIRAFSSSYASSSIGKQGLVNVYQNGILINSKCPVAGYTVDVDSPNTGTLNFFTAYTTGIADFFLEDKGSKKLKFYGEQFFVSPSDFLWLDDARLRLNKPSSNDCYKMIVSCRGALGAYYGNCDVYGSCQQAKVGDQILSSFPNLKVNDAIYSSAANSNVYNCASWAGGLTYGWTWGKITQNKISSQLVGPNYGSPTIWSTWDAYFANTPQRYAGATSYTREGANASNGEIAVWSKNGDITGVSHFSCKATANNQPHGYAWESKPGALRRVFHPRDALSCEDYGSIFAYYRNANISPSESKSMVMSKNIFQEKSMSFEESIKKGLTVIKDVKLTSDQERLFNKVTTRSSMPLESSKIAALYNAWENRISAAEYMCISNPYTLIDIKEGQELMEYSKRNKNEAFLFFVNLYFFDTEQTEAKSVSYYMFCDIFSEYAEVIEKIKKDWEKNQYDENGAYVAPLPEFFLKTYVKNLIDKIIK